ncbi:MAG: ABC transporter ATP-binding protein [SAR324 cluster bacterium]|nr:ABC transporter ATP-binding protein [SAR324 cluster bacterium]
MTQLLEVIDLEKSYGRVEAVRGISFTVTKGSCFGLLGPNGAGKTTTIEVIENVISLTAGTILYKGEPRNNSFKEEVGIQFQETALLAFMTVRETLKTFQSFYNESSDLEKLIETCHLGEFQHQYNDRISGGQKQRFLLALALINQPTLLFLDEPSTGLDPQARRNLWQIVEQIKAEGKTIILTTHYMEEAQHLCDEVAIMDNGRIIAQGSPDELIRKHGGERSISLPRSALNGMMDKLPFQSRGSQDRVELLTEDINACLQLLMHEKIDLSELTVNVQNLESVFLNLTGRQLRE